MQRPDLEHLYDYFAKASDCSHKDLRAIGELIEYTRHLEARNRELEAERDTLAKFRKTMDDLSRQIVAAYPEYKGRPLDSVILEWRPKRKD